MNVKKISWTVLCTIMLLGCVSEDVTNVEKEVTSTNVLSSYDHTSYDGARYVELYKKFQEGMTLAEAGLVSEEYWEDNVLYQAHTWAAFDGSNDIGCDFIDNVCSWKNGWSLNAGFIRGLDESGEELTRIYNE